LAAERRQGGNDKDPLSVNPEYSEDLRAERCPRTYRGRFHGTKTPKTARNFHNRPVVSGKRERDEEDEDMGHRGRRMEGLAEKSEIASK